MSHTGNHPVEHHQHQVPDLPILGLLSTYIRLPTYLYWSKLDTSSAAPDDVGTGSP
jgi:hypothetical protein